MIIGHAQKFRNDFRRGWRFDAFFQSKGGAAGRGRRLFILGMAYLCRKIGPIEQQGGDAAKFSDKSGPTGFGIMRTFSLQPTRAMTLTKAELTNSLVAGIGLNTREAKDMVEAFFQEISASLEAGEEVKLAGFGRLRVRDKVARPGRNPKTGVVVTVSARRVVTFHASPALKYVVEAGSQFEQRAA